jgi:hypothetical protein
VANVSESIRAMTARAAWIAFVLAAVCATAATAHHTGFELVTTEEFRREKDARDLVTRSAKAQQPAEAKSERSADGPSIDVITPNASGTVHAPVDISVRFAPGPEARIVIDSLHVRYGVIGLDVTDRIRKAARVTEQGIEAPGASLPPGSHSMSIEISDSLGRTTRQAFRFRVEK